MVASDLPHIPVLIDPLIAAVAPVDGPWIDGTFGNGGYAERLLKAGARHVTGVDRDPAAAPVGAAFSDRWPDRFALVETTFSELDRVTDGAVAGVVLDLGVSSMQLDQAERGFSFQKDGPLDMRMSQTGPTAADLVNTAEQDFLADILYHYGEERSARKIARAIVEDRPFTTTLALAQTISNVTARHKPSQIHPATRSFQALRIAVNDEFGELITGLEAAERALAPGGSLAVVTFHSLEDRVVKRFLLEKSGRAQSTNRYAPEVATEAPTFDVTHRVIMASDEEIAANPRARSAKLRVARRTEAPARASDRTAMGLPGPKHWWKEGRHQ